MMLVGVAVLLSLNFKKLKTKLETLTLQFFSNTQNTTTNKRSEILLFQAKNIRFYWIRISIYIIKCIFPGRVHFLKIYFEGIKSFVRFSFSAPSVPSEHVWHWVANYSVTKTKQNIILQGNHNSIHTLEIEEITGCQWEHMGATFLLFN